MPSGEMRARIGGRESAASGRAAARRARECAPRPPPPQPSPWKKLLLPDPFAPTEEWCGRWWEAGGRPGGPQPGARFARCPPPSPTDDVDARGERFRHRLVLVRLEALDDDLKRGGGGGGGGAQAIGEAGTRAPPSRRACLMYMAPAGRARPRALARVEGEGAGPREGAAGGGARGSRRRGPGAREGAGGGCASVGRRERGRRAAAGSEMQAGAGARPLATPPLLRSPNAARRDAPRARHPSTGDPAAGLRPPRAAGGARRRRDRGRPAAARARGRAELEWGRWRR
jgi:hypothetical protein